MTTYKIPDLAMKVAFVVGNCEFRRIRQMLLQNDSRKNEPSHKRISGYTKQGAISGQLGIDPSQWSRMKKGKETINDVHLAKLSEYFDVDRSCDFLVWIKPYEVFTTTLTTLGYGRLRYRATGQALKDFLDQRVDPENSGIRVTMVASSSSMRGIGTPESASLVPIELRPGDRVRIAVAGTGGLYHLVLLSCGASDEFIVLSPMASGSATMAIEPETLLPRDNGAYPVGRPFGPYLLYAILTKQSLGLESRLNFVPPFPTLSTIEEDALRDAIAGQGDDNLRVRRLPYEVVR